MVSEIRKNKFFSVLADELLDCSNKEQLSIVIRYVDSSRNIKEDFLKFLHCKEGLTGAGFTPAYVVCSAKFKSRFQ